MIQPKYEKVDEVTVSVTHDSVDGEVKKVWTLETLEHAVAQVDLDIEKLQKKKEGYVETQEKAKALGVIHPKDVIVPEPEPVEAEEEDKEE